MTTESPCCPPRPAAKSATGCCEPKPTEKTESCCPPPAPSSRSRRLPAQETTDCSPTAETACCPSGPKNDRPGYRLCDYVSGWHKSPVGEVPQIGSRLTRADLLGRWQMRWGIGRQRYQVTPGLYALGSPDASSAVLVSANYKMSFDLLRRSLCGRNLWILVIDTRGINVWCAAGKGTFGTEEIVRRVKACRLDELVRHRNLVLPQLGAPGVSAHKVKQGCGFSVSYGPVQAGDLPAYLDAGFKATPEMRRVRFGTLDRFVLTPVELVSMGKISLWMLLALLVLGGIGPGIFSLSAAFSRGGAALLAYLAAVAAGAVLTPVLLPWVPGRAFSLKGALVGGSLALPILPLLGSAIGALNCLALLLGSMAVSSYCAMNFTGSTTFTSPSGVEKEMRRFIPLQAGALLIAACSWVGTAFL